MKSLLCMFSTLHNECIYSIYPKIKKKTEKTSTF